MMKTTIAIENKQGAFRDCLICSSLPTGKRYDYDADVPQAVEQLALCYASTMKRCPYCGTWYTCERTSRFMSPCEGMGEEITIDLRRLSPPELLRRLKGRELANYRKNLDNVLAEYWSDLTHSAQHVKENAAWALTRTCIDKRDAEGMRRLLSHPDRFIRYTASLAYRNLDLTAIDATSFVALLTECLADSDATVRGNCAAILACHWVMRNAIDKLHEMLELEDHGVKESVVFRLSVAAASGFDLSSFVPDLNKLLLFPDRHVRGCAARALKEFGIAPAGENQA